MDHFVGFFGSLLLAACLAACGGNSSSGGSSVLGGSQDPDPVIVDFPLVYVSRPLLTDEDGNLLTQEARNATAFFPGAELIFRDRASASAEDTVLTTGIFPDDEDGEAPLYDVKDLDVSFDGARLVFAMRAPEIPDADEEDQPTWNIWLFDRDSLTVTRVIDSDIVAEDGHDVAPRFLPDGRIVFASTRQRHAKAVLLDEGKPQFSALDEDRDRPALALHVMNEDGSGIQQITYNQSSDLDPTVLSDGRIAYSRWDNVAGTDRVSLYTVRPDGTESSYLYGVHSHDTGPNGQTIEFMESTELPDGRLLVLMRPNGEQTRMGALPVAIDVAAYVEHDQPTAANAGLLADAQELLIDGDLNLDDNTPAVQGRYASVWPLTDGTDRLVVSWSQCRLRDTTSDPADPVIAPCSTDNLADPNFVEADPLYGIWMHDLVEETAQPIVTGTADRAHTDARIMESRTAPVVLIDKTPGVDLDADQVAASIGVVNVRSVYDFDGTAIADIAALADRAQTQADARPARFVRLVKAVSMPDDDLVDLEGTDFGRSQAQLMREIIGYAPVQPDGSVRVAAPANVAFWLDVLDANGRRIGPRHNNWMHLRPGDAVTCNGCHTPDSELPHGRPDAEADSAHAGAPVDGQPYPNTNAALFADAGETMAEVFARINGEQNPTVDVLFEDVWTDPAVRDIDDPIAYRYSDLTTTVPVDTGCVGQWNSACRIVINYETHVHPLWSVDRAANTCTNCHNTEDAMAMPMVPAAQLDLSDGASPDEADHFISYRELLFNDNEQEVVDGILQDRLVQATDNDGNPLFQTDGNGDLILDTDGNPIPVLVPVGTTPPMSVAGAFASPRFFDRFATGGTHEGFMTGAELRLISEWIDLGGQYYNNPFDTPP